MSPLANASTTVVGNNVDDEFCDGLCFSWSGVFRYGAGVERRGIDVERAARMHEISHEKSDEQRNAGDHFKIEERLAADPADFFHVVHSGDAGNQRAENHQSNDHGDQADEGIAEWLHGHGSGGCSRSRG